MSLTDKAKNSAQIAQGSVKDVAGRVKDDPTLEAKGKAERAVGNLKQAGEKVKDAVRKP
jgi:uncharacterized protein YjbJ (UPF0337 family)